MYHSITFATCIGFYVHLHRNIAEAGRALELYAVT